MAILILLVKWRADSKLTSRIRNLPWELLSPVERTTIFEMELVLHTLPLKSKQSKSISFFFFFISKMGVSTENLNGVDGNVTLLWKKEGEIINGRKYPVQIGAFMGFGYMGIPLYLVVHMHLRISGPFRMGCSHAYMLFMIVENWLLIWVYAFHDHLELVVHMRLGV